ncbi:hypothetical protein ACWDR0_14035 [Streptomyces sp. NPDC003691]
MRSRAILAAGAALAAAITLMTPSAQASTATVPDPEVPAPFYCIIGTERSWQANYLTDVRSTPSNSGRYLGSIPVGGRRTGCSVPTNGNPAGQCGGGDQWVIINWSGHKGYAPARCMRPV